MELKNCPFCNGVAEIKRTTHGTNAKGDYTITWQVSCPTCLISFTAADIISRPDSDVIIIFDGRKKAIDMWNNRAEV